MPAATSSVGIDFSLPQSWLLPDLLPSSLPRSLVALGSWVLFWGPRERQGSAKSSTGPGTGGALWTPQWSRAGEQGAKPQQQNEGPGKQQDGEELIWSVLGVLRAPSAAGSSGPGR